MKKHWLLALAFAILVAAGANAQEKGITVSGKVTDNKGVGLPGANIILQEYLLGASADLKGEYKFLVPEKFIDGKEVEISAKYIGYRSQTKKVVLAAGVMKLDFVLAIDALQMDEVVVTGTGYELKKKELTTPITTINMTEIEMAPVQSIDELLQARVTGGTVNVNTGQPGTGSRIRVRGVKSATVSQTPVIYVDGVRVDANDNFRLEFGSGGPVSNSINDILVGDVERVEVIKGGAAATLYGSEAANGVIQIFTRKGKAGPPRWKFKLEQGLEQPVTNFIVEDFTKNEVLKNGYYRRYTASVDGGSANLTYHLSGHIKASDGTLPKNNDKRYGLQAGFRAFPNDKTQIDFSGGLVRDQFERIYSNNAIAGVLSTIEAHDPQFFGEGVTQQDRLNKLKEYLSPQNDETVNRFTFGTTVRYDPSPLFSTKFTLGTDYRRSEQRYFISREGEVITSTPGGGLFRSDRDFMTLTLDWANTIKYPSKGDFTSNFTFGAQGFREEDREFRVDAQVFGLPGTDDFDNAAELTPYEDNQEIFSGGFFFNEQLGYKNKLFLATGVRFDGNTAFGDQVNLVGYPKVGLAYNISDESFWPSSRWVSPLKLRASYGQTGSFPQPFTRDKTFAQGSYLGLVAASFNNPGEPTLKPEKTATIEYGFDAAFLNERIALEFTVFQDKTTDALFSVPSQPSTGLGFQLRNVGTIENKGMELAVDATVLRTKNVRFEIGGSFSTLDNKVASLGGAQPFSIGGFSFLPLRIEEGYPVGVFRTNVPTGNGEYLANQLLHSPIADKVWGVHANLSLWRNLNLRIIGDGQIGGSILNTGSVLRYFNGGEPQASKVPEGYNFVTASDIFVEDASFFKIREITLSYVVPNKFLGVGFTLLANVRNVLIFCDNKDLDPELNGVRAARDVDVGGINLFTEEPPREIHFGIIFEY